MVMAKRHILVVDDEPRIRDVVEYALCRDGYAVSCVEDGRRALQQLTEHRFDLIVLDVMLPDMSGLEVCRGIRAKDTVPILFLSARSDEVDRIVGLELGGDDYLVKPFSPRELSARVTAILRRCETVQNDIQATRDVLECGPLSIDRERHEVRWAGTVVVLTATEFALLAALYERPQMVHTRAQLIERAYPDQIHVSERTLDTHVRRIRAKFRAVLADPVRTVNGVGYRAAVD
jgi:two-component system, OmpR family, response regulator